MNTGTQTRKSKEKAAEKRLGVIILLIIIAVVVVVAVTLGTRAITAGGTSFVEIPLVETRLTAADGTSHIFGARVAIEVEGSGTRLTSDFLHSEVLAAISVLSYDDISSFHGMNILRNVVQERLDPHFGEGELVAVYFTDVLSGVPMPSRQVDTRPRNNTVFDAIFGNR